MRRPSCASCYLSFPVQPLALQQVALLPVQPPPALYRWHDRCCYRLLLAIPFLLLGPQLIRYDRRRKAFRVAPQHRYHDPTTTANNDLRKRSALGRCAAPCRHRHPLFDPLTVHFPLSPCQHQLHQRYFLLRRLLRLPVRRLAARPRLQRLALLLRLV